MQCTAGTATAGPRAVSRRSSLFIRRGVAFCLLPHKVTVQFVAHYRDCNIFEVQNIKTFYVSNINRLVFVFKPLKVVTMCSSCRNKSVTVHLPTDCIHWFRIISFRRSCFVNEWNQKLIFIMVTFSLRYKLVS